MVSPSKKNIGSLEEPAAPHDGCPRDPYLHQSTPGAKNKKRATATLKKAWFNPANTGKKRVQPIENGGLNNKNHRIKGLDKRTCAFRPSKDKD